MEIVNGNPINEGKPHVHNSHSTFDLEQTILDTHRFGEYHPHFVLDGVSSDKHPFRSKHNARSYTLKAPLMQDIQMHKDYFMVNLRAILPFQAERIITNPTIGDDVPSDSYTSVAEFNSVISKIVYKALTEVENNYDNSNPDTIVTCNTIILKLLILLESVYSNGSLLASLGCNLSRCFYYTPYNIGTPGLLGLTIDHLLNFVINNITTSTAGSFSVVIDNASYDVKLSLPNYVLGNSGSNLISVHDFLQRIRDTSDWYFVPDGNLPDFDLDALIVGAGDGQYMNRFVFVNADSSTPSDAPFPVDLARLWAYHLGVAEFFTNDKVDYIYSAELFREYIRALFIDYDSDLNFSFTWNGMKMPYDYLSAKYFNYFSNNTVSTHTLSHSYSSGKPDYPSLYQYFLTLFGYHRSLRYKDYFSGARTRPLAVGDTNVQVNSNLVSVIDVTRKIQTQRFLNAVQITGRKFKEYIKGIFGVEPATDMHDPIFLAHTTDSIFASEVENTADAQWQQKNSVTAVFRGNGNQFVYEVSVNEPCVIIGVTSYDIIRSYPHMVERSFLKKDRYDMFIPELQYVGDQDVKQVELDSGFPYAMNPFGYQFRDMQYKQLVNRAVGGFSDNVLPGYAFVYKPERPNVTVISPDFIRSRNAELDEFYLSLSGYSLGTYFHFIVMTENYSRSSRPMAVNPQILG